jgi:hypothetical protein
LILQPEDISILSEWWGKLGAPLNERYLPPLSFGVWGNDDLLCGCFLYVFDVGGGKAGLVSHTITNPDRPLRALSSVNTMLREIRVWGERSGLIHLMGFTKSRLLAKSYEDNEFQLVDEKMNLFVL